MVTTPAIISLQQMARKRDKANGTLSSRATLGLPVLVSRLTTWKLLLSIQILTKAGHIQAVGRARLGGKVPLTGAHLP